MHNDFLVAISRGAKTQKFFQSQSNITSIDTLVSVKRTSYIDLNQPLIWIFRILQQSEDRVYAIKKNVVNASLVDSTHNDLVYLFIDANVKRTCSPILREKL